MSCNQIPKEARRTTRILLRVPVLLIAEEEGRTLLTCGWTMDVNIHGARIESQSRFAPDDEVTIQVPYSGLSQKGKVIWCRSEPNQNGAYEIGVQLDKPENLWGVGFPPDDWLSSEASEEAAKRVCLPPLGEAPAPEIRPGASGATLPVERAESSSIAGRGPSIGFLAGGSQAPKILSSAEQSPNRPLSLPRSERSSQPVSIPVEGLSAEAVAALQIALRSGLEQQLPALTKELLEQCLIQGERLMAAQVEQWTLLFSDRVQAALQSMQKRLEEQLESIVSRHETALSARAEELREQTGERLEQQLQRIGTQVRQGFLRHIVTELSRSQQVWLKQAERQMERMEQEYFERARLDLAQFLKHIGESLTLPALAPAETQAASPAGAERQAELPLQTDRSETPTTTPSRKG